MLLLKLSIPLFLIISLLVLQDSDTADAEPVVNQEVPCVNCEDQKVAAPEGINLVEFARKSKAEMDEKRRIRSSEEWDKKYMTWQGTEVSVSAIVPEAQKVQLVATTKLVPLLPVPQGRADAFKLYNGTDHWLKLIGWRANVQSLSAAEGGLEAEIVFSPQLLGRTATGLLDRYTTEKWFFPLEGAPQLKSSIIGGKSTLIGIMRPYYSK